MSHFEGKVVNRASREMLGRIPGVSQEKRPAFQRLLLPEYISNEILQYLIK